MSSYRSRWGIVATTGAVAAALALTAAPASATSPAPAAHPGAPTAVKTPLAIGRGGAVSTVDFDASRAGLADPAAGGNAADAAVAAAAALGVTEPFSAGIGGGGYFVYYDARHARVSTIDGRETAPAAFDAETLRRSADGLPYPFADGRHERAVGRRPGDARHLADGRPAVRHHARSRKLLQPADPDRRARLRRRRRRSHDQVAANAARFAPVQLDQRALPARRRSRRRSAAPSATPTSPRTYRLLARQGIGTLLHGPARARDRRDGAAPAASAPGRARR